MRTSFLRGAVIVLAAALWTLASPLAARAQQQDKWEAPPEAKKLQNPVATDGRTVERGHKLFQRFCVPCHGTVGAADGRMARKLGYKPANLTLEQMTQLSDGEIFWKISKGKAPMPAYQEQLSTRERWDVVSYVRTLMKTTQ